LPIVPTKSHAHRPASTDFVELFNTGGSVVNLNNLVLTDDPATNKFVITNVPCARSYVAFTRSNGLSLRAGARPCS
jgi:hypothetical protein